MTRWSLRVPILRDPLNRVPIRTVSFEGYLETVRMVTAIVRADGTRVPIVKQ